MARSRTKPRRTTRRKPRAHPSGTLHVAREGYGFVQTAEGEFFVPASKMAGAFDGDVVQVAPAGGRGGADGARTRPAGRVVAVLQRAHETVVGRYEVADPFGVVVPLDARIGHDIFTMRADNPSIPDGAIVRVRMREYPTRNTAATGVVEEVLGDAEDGHAGIEAIIARRGLATAFSPDALEQAKTVHVDAPGALASGYRDITERFAFTIDPFDARDFDDSVSVEQLQSDRVRLGVHIADVSHYVAWGSAIDREARKRATSVYLADRVLPMLPESLSNDVCSLVPGQARRVFTVDITVDGAGRVHAVEAYPALMCSKARLSYEQADCLLSALRSGLDVQEARHAALACPVPEGAAMPDEACTRKLCEALGRLDGIARARHDARTAAGGIDIEATEARVVLDDDAKPTDVVLRRKTPATACIEEAMVLANECVARLLLKGHTPALFRVHEPPAPDALAALVPVLQEFGLDRCCQLEHVLAGEPHALQGVLDAVRGRPESELVGSLVLRSMQRAVYRCSCDGHYGLASDAYCHFTSPIRRYPDLVVHRMLKAQLLGRSDSYQAQCDALPGLAEHCSAAERTAEAAARKSQELKLVEYMARHVGECFDGVVSGVSTLGLFVRLPNTVEGVVPMRELGGEYFSYDPRLHKLAGQATGRTFRLGQQLRVRIQDAQPLATKLDLRLAH